MNEAMERGLREACLRDPVGDNGSERTSAQYANINILYTYMLPPIEIQQEVFGQTGSNKCLETLKQTD